MLIYLTADPGVNADRSNAYHVRNLFAAKFICREIIQVALDDLHGASGRENEKIAFLEADATATLHRALDFGDLGLIDEGAAMAVAAVRLRWCLGLGRHVYGVSSRNTISKYGENLERNRWI